MRSVTIQTYIWLALPVLIFLACWLREMVSVPLTAATLASLAWIFSRRKESPIFHSEGFAGAIRRDRRLLWISLALVAAVILCGIGGLVSQTSTDQFGRNGVFYDLVARPWPVEYPPVDGNPRIMCYYLAYWLPSALVAKMFGGSMLAGNLFQIVWASWGLFLTLAFLFSYCGSRKLWLVFLLFFFFCGWEMVEGLLFYPQEKFDFFTFMENHNDTAVPYYALPLSHSTIIQAYNQAIPAFLGFSLLYFQRRSPGWMLFTFSLILCYAPMPCLGIFPAMLYWLGRNFRTSLSLPNLLGLALCLIFSIFFIANAKGSHTEVASDPDHILMVLGYGAAWLALSVAVYLPFIWRSVKSDWLFWTLLVTSLLGALLSAYGSPDVGWRIPTALGLYLMAKVAREAVSTTHWGRPRNILFAAALAIGSLSPLTSYYLRLHYEVREVIVKGESPRDTRIEGYLTDPGRNPYYYNYVSERAGFFYRHLMRRHR